MCAYLALPNDVEHHGEQVKQVCRPRTLTPALSLTIFEWSVRRVGFRVIFVTEGLATLAAGCLISGPVGWKIHSGFLRKHLVVASLSTHETAAELFLSIFGSPRYIEIQLDSSQAV
ncbi:hypothetical protein BDV09DRAFT_200479 [Aspergillus tetrazonus]